MTIRLLICVLSDCRSLWLGWLRCCTWKMKFQDEGCKFWFCLKLFQIFFLQATYFKSRKVFNLKSCNEKQEQDEERMSKKWIVIIIVVLCINLIYSLDESYLHSVLWRPHYLQVLYNRKNKLSLHFYPGGHFYFIHKMW